jgi:hypothetical protein
LAPVAPFGGPIVDEIALGLGERDVVAAAWHEGEAQLGEIVLPAADRAGLMETGLPVMDQVAATRAGKLLRADHSYVRGLGVRCFRTPTINPELGEGLR